MRKFIDLFMISDGDPEIALAQYASFSKQIPLLYATLLVNTWGLAYSFRTFAPATLAIYVPAALTLVCAGRIVAWFRAIGTTPDVATAMRALRRTNSLSGVLAFLFAAWGLCLFHYGDAYAQAHVVFFMGITVIGCVFCLMHLRSAALRVMLTVNTMFVSFFISSGNQVFVAISINILLVSSVMLTVLWVSYNSFMDLIQSRRALDLKQAETQRLSDENYRLANLDSLTGLPNRRLFFAELDRIPLSGAFDKTMTAVGIVDLDGFKAVNDGYGHLAGDALLKVIASRLAKRSGSDIVVSRLGGDEFGLIIRRFHIESDLLTLGADICRDIDSLIVLAEGSAVVSASIGFAVVSNDADSVRSAFENADYALYDAKRSGKGKAVLFTPTHREAIRTAAKMERAFDHPNFETELTVVFQPIMDIERGQVIAFEALARWHNEELGSVSPSVFIPAAERSGKIVYLTAMLLEKSLAVARHWPAHIRLSFNLSAKDIISAESMTRLLGVISRSGIDPKRLDFEITETAALNDLSHARASINMLKTWGIGISLDDFGSGYSSLSEVHQLALDIIKIDRSFVSDIATNPMSYKIVKSVLALCRDMDIDCIVEGVETNEVLDILKILGCNWAQGYFFAMPLEADRIAEYLTKHGYVSEKVISAA